MSIAGGCRAIMISTNALLGLQSRSTGIHNGQTPACTICGFDSMFTSDCFETPGASTLGRPSAKRYKNQATSSL